MSNPLQFSIDYGKPRPDQRRTRDEPLRILFLTDLGETCRSRAATPLATRPIRPIDIDNFEAFLETEQPVLHLLTGDIRLREMDHFHPEQLCQNLPMFQPLANLRRRLLAPASFEAAAQEARAMLQSDGSTPTAAAGADAEGDADTLSRLFGKLVPSSKTAAPAALDGFMNNLLRDAVAAHIVTDADPEAGQYIEAVDAAAAAHMRAVLHDPAFQSLEAAWRGLDLLVSNIETDSDLSVHVWNVGKGELLDALGPADRSLDQSILHQKLVEQQEDRPFTLIVTDIIFGRDADDLRLLATLGALAGRSGAVVLAGIAPEIVGADSWDAIAKAPETLGEPVTGWTALRASGLGSRIIVLAPKFLLRTPYGNRLDPVDAFFEFEELEQPGDADAPFLWGTSSLLATVLIAKSFGQEGWDARLSANLAYGDLPFVPFEADGEKQMRPCAEAFLPDRAAEAVLKAGPIPVMAVRNHNEVRLSCFQSIASAGDSGSIGPFSV